MSNERGEFTLHVSDIGRPFDVSTTDFEENPLVRKGIQPGASGVDFTLPRGYPAFVRLRDARTGSALALGQDAQLLVRGEPAYGFWPWQPVSPAPDADGWYEFRFTAPAVDLLVLPRAAELPQYGATHLRRAKLDGGAPARLELVLDRGVDVALELAEGAAAWPADHELLLVAEDYGPGQGKHARYPSPFDELAAQCTATFDTHGRALLRGLAPGSYRFTVLPPDLLVEPEFVRVDAQTLPVRVRWSAKK